MRKFEMAEGDEETAEKLLERKEDTRVEVQQDC